MTEIEEKIKKIENDKNDEIHKLENKISELNDNISKIKNEENKNNTTEDTEKETKIKELSSKIEFLHKKIEKYIKEDKDTNPRDNKFLNEEDIEQFSNKIEERSPW
jgi:phage host-nuclease inhibitor protein Gam